MKSKPITVDVLIGAVLKLDGRNGERKNVLAFIQSCYCGRVRSYDLEAALAALGTLSDVEQHALITWAVLEDERGSNRQRRAGA